MPVYTQNRYLPLRGPNHENPGQSARSNGYGARTLAQAVRHASAHLSGSIRELRSDGLQESPLDGRREHARVRRVDLRRPFLRDNVGCFLVPIRVSHSFCPLDTIR